MALLAPASRHYFGRLPSLSGRLSAKTPRWSAAFLLRYSSFERFSSEQIRRYTSDSAVDIEFPTERQNQTADGAVITEMCLDGQRDPDDAAAIARRKRRSESNKRTRFRQHANPLSKQNQQPIILSDSWPRDAYFTSSKSDNGNSTCHKPLHLDIGCAKGTFLIELATKEIGAGKENEFNDNGRNHSYNYMGLEIRSAVAEYAKERLERRPWLQGKVEFLGCNANVDLDRLLQLYHDAVDDSSNAPKDLRLKRVTIQYPDPHFKARHAKRRVVTPQLVETLAKYMPTSDGDDVELSSPSVVFLQSDVESVLLDMQEVFEQEQSRYFSKLWNHTSHSDEDNPMGVPTERELSVLKQDKPVYRSLFYRNHVPYC